MWYETSKYKLHQGTVIGHFRQLLDMDVTVIGHFRQLLDMDVTVIGHLHIFSNIVKYMYNMYP